MGKFARRCSELSSSSYPSSSSSSFSSFSSFSPEKFFLSILISFAKRGPGHGGLGNGTGIGEGRPTFYGSRIFFLGGGLWIIY